MSSLHNVFCSSAMELTEIRTKYVHGNRLAALMHVHRLWYTWSSKLNTNIQQSFLLPARDTQDSDRQCVTAHVSVGLSPDVATSETAQDQRHMCPGPLQAGSGVCSYLCNVVSTRHPNALHCGWAVQGEVRGSPTVPPADSDITLCHVMSCDIMHHVRQTHLEAAIASLMAKNTLEARNRGGSPIA